MPTPDSARVAALAAQERQRFAATHPESLRLAAASAPHFLFGVPMHWMRDWPMPSPLFVREAQGNQLICADGLHYRDFCLGDTGAMYGHSPEPVARAIAAQAARGLTAMLPGALLPEVGALLTECFGLPRWQIVLTATDANRFVLRWARAVTGRAKVLVFEGCYHGTVADTLVDRADDGRTLTRASLLGQVHDLAQSTVVVPFNDEPALRAALAAGDVACVLTEPALTNCGLVPPRPGFMPAVQAACRETGTLFVLDETHTVSSGLGGWGRVHGLAPDFIVVGKAVAGGLPTAVYGFTEEMAARMEAAKAAAPDGHSGIGTTLSANVLQLAALHAQLSEVATPEAHARMDALAARLQAGIERVLAQAGVGWSVARIGARMELQYGATPANGREAQALMNDDWTRCLHLFMLNRGVLITPFHHMLLVPPCASEADVDAVPPLLAQWLAEVGQGQPGA